MHLRKFLSTVVVLAVGCGATSERRAGQDASAGGGGSWQAASTPASSATGGGAGGGAGAQTSSTGSAGGGGKGECPAAKVPFHVTIKIDQGPSSTLSSCDPDYPDGPLAFVFNNDKNPAPGFRIVACAAPGTPPSLDVNPYLSAVGATDFPYPLQLSDEQGSDYYGVAPMTFTISKIGEVYETVTGNFAAQLDVVSGAPAKVYVEGDFVVCRAPDVFAL